GDTTVSGGNVSFNSAPTLNTLHLTSGTLTGSANITSLGLFTWTAGTLAGTATPNATFTVGAGGVDFNGGTVHATPPPPTPPLPPPPPPPSPPTPPPCALLRRPVGLVAAPPPPNATFTVGAGGVDFNGGSVNGTSHSLSQRTFNFAASTATVSGQTNSF